MRTRIALFTLCVGMAFAFWANGEFKEYSPAENPGTVYFVSVTNTYGGSHIFTNQESFMWYPSRIDTIFGSAVTSTNTLDQVIVWTDVQVTPYVVVTNEFNAIQTNWVHSSSNVYSYITNRICAWTNVASASGHVVSEGCYIQKGDILRYSFSCTNLMWLKTTARR
jgi:hypothetical protein